MAAVREDLLLEGEFTLLGKKKLPHRVMLTRTGLFFHPISNNKATYTEMCIHVSDIIGCHDFGQYGNGSKNDPTSALGENKSENLIFLEESGNEVRRLLPHISDASAYGFVVFAYPFKKKLFSSKRARARQVLAFQTTSACAESVEKRTVAETWRNVINCLCRGLPVDAKDPSSCVPPPRERILMLINPHSGPGKALSIFKNEISPMLCEACIPYKAVVTDHAGHAGELMTRINLSEWYGVVVVSGDGLVFETINGIMQRDDWTTAIKCPIGCLPGGSGNALSCSINYAAGEPLDVRQVLHSTFVLVKHRVVPMDLVAVHIPDRTIFSFLSVTWGMVADIDFESEKYRKLGEARFTVGAVRRIIGLRSYRGRISFLPVAEYTPKVTAASKKVLAKVRRLSLDSRNSSRSKFSSEESSASNGSNNRAAVAQNGNHLGDLAAAGDSAAHMESDVTSVNDSSVFSCSDLKDVNQVACSLITEDGGIVIGDEHHVDSLTGCHAGGDSWHSNGGNRIREDTSDQGALNSVSQDSQERESTGFPTVSGDILPVLDLEGIKSSGFVENGHSMAQEGTQLKKSNSHSSHGHRSDCTIEHNSSMTILSDTEEVNVERETYHVRKTHSTPVSTPLLRPLDQGVPDNWVTLDESFVLAIAMFQTHLGSDMLAAPDAHLSDGHIHLMMVREGISRNTLLNLFLTFGQGRHVDSPYVDIVKVLAFRIEPASKTGNIMVDGERFDPTPIQGQILPGLARVMAIK